MITRFRLYPQLSRNIARNYATVPHDAISWPLKRPLDPKTVIEKVASSPKVAALHARLGFNSSFPKTTLAQAFIDDTVFPQQPQISNRALAQLGQTLCDYFALERFMIKYPRLPIAALEAAVSSFVGKRSMEVLVRSWGVESGLPDEMHLGRVLFGRVRDGFLPDDTHKYAVDAMSQMGFALVGGLYVHQGLNEVKKFMYEFVFSRHLSIESLFVVPDPVRQLIRLCQTRNLPRPVARILAESGRHSNSPVFVVAFYIDGQKVGEGDGNSIKEARFRAAANAIRAWYLYERRISDVPSATISEDTKIEDVPSKHTKSRDVESGSVKNYRPGYIDEGEIMV